MRRLRWIPEPLAVPPLLWLLGFLGFPLCGILFISFQERGTYGGIIPNATWENYARVLDPLYLRIFWNSLKLAILTTISCLALGFPMALFLAAARGAGRAILLFLVVLPFWTNFVVRGYAIQALLAEGGPLNGLLLAIGFTDEPIALTRSPVAVWLGMVSNYLPFLVLPLSVSLAKIDPALLEAARDLGAGSGALLVRIVIPLSWPGIAAGSLLVFAPSLGEFVIPDLLGGAKVMLIGNLVTDQFLKARHWPFGSALSVLLLALVALFVGVARGASRRRSEFGPPREPEVIA